MASVASMKKVGIEWYFLSSSLHWEGKQMPSREHLYSYAHPAKRAPFPPHLHLPSKDKAHRGWEEQLTLSLRQGIC